MRNYSPSTQSISGRNHQERTVPSKIQKFEKLVKTELDVCHPRLWLAQLLLSPLPIHVGGRIRATFLSWIGFDIGAGTLIWGMPTITGPRNLYQRLHVGRECWFNVGCHLDLGATITIGDRVSIGHQVMFLTTTHEIDSPHRRAGALQKQPIIVKDGAWLGARSILLPGVIIHEGAVIGAGAVVTRDAPAHSLVAGVPAVVIRELEKDESSVLSG